MLPRPESVRDGETETKNKTGLQPNLFQAAPVPARYPNNLLTTRQSTRQLIICEPGDNARDAGI